MVPIMGDIDKHKVGLSEVLFSKTQRRILGFLFGQPEKSFYSKEIVDLAGVGTGTVHRELEKLSGCNLLTVKRIGNQKHYQANPASPIFEELQGIVRKTFGLADPLRVALGPYIDKIKVAFIYGSIAKGTDTTESDIDLMLISDELTYPDLFTSISELENQLGRQINPTIYTDEDFRYKIASGNNFIIKVIGQPKIFLIGSEDDIPAV